MAGFDWISLCTDYGYVDGFVAACHGVMARIAPQGLKLLSRLDEPIQKGHRKQLGHLGRDRLRALTDLLQAARSEVG